MPKKKAVKNKSVKAVRKSPPKKPLVSINVPTYNSEKTLALTLEAAKRQTYDNVEILLIDSYSSDRTLEIAKKFGCKIVMCKGGLLEARVRGAEESKGDFVLFLDSDQILHQETIAKCVEAIKEHDCLWLYERAYNRHKWIPSLYDADRLLVQKHLEEDVVLPRFFKKDLLLKAMKNIPPEIYDVCKAHDHLILRNEFFRVSKNMGRVGDLSMPAVEHIEPSNLPNLIKKQYRWGRTTRDFYEKGFYKGTIKSRNSFRKIHPNDLRWSLKSLILRVLRGIPYKFGYWFG